MESQEQREENKSSKTIAVIAAILIVGGIAFAAYKGIIPGLGGGSKTASELKANIESAKGGNIKSKVIALYQSNPTIPQSFKDELTKALNQDVDISFDYAGLKTSSGDGKGTVEIDSPKLVIKPLSQAEKTSPLEIRAEKVFLSRDNNDANHYFFHSEGNVDFYGDTSDSGTVSKIFTITADSPTNEFRYSADMQSGYMKSTAKNIKFIEGRGNTILATVGDLYTEGERKKDGSKIDIWGKLSYKNIMPGDTMKLMLGATEPFSLGMDYSYKGDDYNEQIVKLMEYPQQQQAERVKAMKDPNYKPATLAEPEFQPFDGELKVNDFSLMMGSAGLSAKGDLVFKKDNKKIIPSGTASVKVAQYQKLIDYFKKFFPIPQDQVDKTVKFLSEIGNNSGGDITVDLKFDGTENVLVGGKTMEQVKAIQAKYYPAMPNDGGAMMSPPSYMPPMPQPGDDKPIPRPSAPVSGKPITDNSTKI